MSDVVSHKIVSWACIVDLKPQKVVKRLGSNVSAAVIGAVTGMDVRSSALGLQRGLSTRFFVGNLHFIIRHDVYCLNPPWKWVKRPLGHRWRAMVDLRVCVKNMTVAKPCYSRISNSYAKVYI